MSHKQQKIIKGSNKHTKITNSKKDKKYKKQRFENVPKYMKPLKSKKYENITKSQKQLKSHNNIKNLKNG